MKWIDINEQLPESCDKRELIVAWKESGFSGSCGGVYFVDGKFITKDEHYGWIDEFTGITHWMLIPDPPK